MRLLRLYSSCLYDRPWLFIVLPLVITGFIPAVLLHFKPVRLTQNAEIGFDTKDTELSGPRLAWKQLQIYLATTNRVPFVNTVPALSSSNTTEVEDAPKTRKPRNWAEDLFSAVQNIACYDAPIPLMEHLAQFVIEVPSFDALFHVDLLKSLCQLHHFSRKQLSGFEAYSPYKNIWSVANFFACMSPNNLVNCTELTAADVETVKQLVESCIPHRDALIECKLKCNQQCTRCKGIPANCSSQMMFDLFYRLLPMNLDAKPFLLNTFFPFFTLTGYSTQNIFIPLYLYDQVEDSLVEYSKQEGLQLKGVLMDVKRERLLKAAVQDSWLALIAAGLILVLVALHSRSILFAFAVFLVLGLSVTASLGVYVTFTQDFPLLNLVIFVLLIAVGTDDAFLLHSSFPEKLDENSFYACLHHTCATMFLTSFSTAVPFFVNILSNVIVFRCFGLFAGVVTIANWLLVVSFLPAFLLLQRRYCDCMTNILPSLGNSLSFSIRQVFPAVILQGRFIWMSLLSVVAIGASYVAFQDLHLPEYNPLQVFTSSNLHEWYDNNAEQHFEFVSAKIAMPLYIRLVWGVAPTESTARFQADANTPLRTMESWSLNSVSAVEKLAHQLHQTRHLPFVNHSEAFWPERFLLWSARYPCEQGFVCCNTGHELFSNSYLDFCLRNSTHFIATSYNDTPIFDNSTFNLAGYSALLPTKLKYNHRFKQLSSAFEKLAQTTPTGGWWTTEWYLMSTWFDLQRSIISDCRSSVIISMVVVAIFACVQLHIQALPAVLTCGCIIATSAGIVVLLGWVLGVLEAVILVLVVGLSFDYTLHYGAALPKEGCPFHRVQKAAAIALAPVSLAATTSFLAGAAMLFSKTHAFFQVGTFLVIVTTVSWTFATFFFIPLLTMTLRRPKDCSFCSATSHYPMKTLSF